MKTNPKSGLNKSLEKIKQDRERTNLLKKYEQQFIAYLVQRIPGFISSDMLTTIGFFGSIIIFLGFILATYVSRDLLLLTVPGFAIHWFGDSLDGRIAYYRNKPRKWYGFVLDITTDWLGVLLLGWGYIIYAPQGWEMFGYIFAVLYGWEIISALLRYKVTGKYSIDSGLLGPTEVRIVLSMIFTLEVIIPGSIFYSAIIACTVLFINNIVDFVKLLKLGDARDKEERAQKQANSQS